MSAPELVDTVGGGLVVAQGLNPIVGEAEPCIRMAGTGFLHTGDLTPGDAGEVGGLFDGLTVELWYLPATATGGFTNIIAQGPNTSTGRQWELQFNSDSTISFKVRDSAGTLSTATSPSPIAINGWTYLVGSFGGGTARLYLNGAQVATASGGGPFNTVLSAGSADLRLGDAGGHIYALYSHFAVYRKALTAARVTAHYAAAIQRGFSAQPAGDRINTVLDRSASHSAPRSVSAGVRTVASAFFNGAPPKAAIADAVSADFVDAAFFVDAAGRVNYRDAAHRSSSPYNASQLTVGDAAGEIPYLELDVDYSESFLFNEWICTMRGTELSGGNPQTALDATSIARYFKRSQSLTGLSVTVDADAATIAAAMLAKYKNPMQRVVNLEFNTIDVNVCEALFRRELMDKITVKRTPPGGGARITQDLYIQKIELSGQNDGGPWSVTWGVSPL